MSDVKVEVTGLVWKVERTAGDSVAAGDVLMIIESMKMEIPVQVGESGTVLKVCVQTGDAVNEGDVVAVLG